MRSKDYKDTKASFTPLTPAQMVRVALVNGINPRVEPNLDERKKYLELLREFSGVSDSTLDILFNWSGQEEKNGRTKNLRDIVHYDSKLWKPFDYRRLRKEGVVEPGPGLDGLVNAAVTLPRHKVIELPRPVERDGVDYLKHVPTRQKLVLNGKDVVVAFAEKHGIKVPEGYLERGGPVPVSMYNYLARAGFTFRAALETAIEVMQKSEVYRTRDISVLVVQHRNGDELRMHHHDFVEAAELYAYAKRHGLSITEALGDKLRPDSEGKYALNVFDTPSKSRKGLTHRVELSYLPDFKNPDRDTLRWMKTSAFCDCEWALNLRNFEFGRGEMTHTASTLETHGGLVVLKLQADSKGNLVYSPQNMNPLPQLEFSRFIDVLRYQVMQGHKDNDYVKETGIEISANVFGRLFGASRMYWPTEKIGAKILDTLY